MAVNRRVPSDPLSGTVMVRSSRSGSLLACASTAWRAASATAARLPTCIEAVWSTTSSPISGRVCRVSSTARGPDSHTSTTAKASTRQIAPRARRQSAGSTASSAERRKPAQQPDRQRRIEAQRGNRLFYVHRHNQ